MKMSASARRTRGTIAAAYVQLAALDERIYNAGTKACPSLLKARRALQLKVERHHMQLLRMDPANLMPKGRRKKKK